MFYLEGDLLLRGHLTISGLGGLLTMEVGGDGGGGRGEHGRQDSSILHSMAEVASLPGIADSLRWKKP